jgi:hypothetical protein
MEAVADEEDADENWDRESDICGNGSHGDSTDSYRPAEDQGQKAVSDGRVEPHSVDTRVGMLADCLDPPRAGEAAITSISASGTGRGTRRPCSLGPSKDRK